jgi:hypothetical protein
MHAGNFLVKDNPLSIDQMDFGVTEEPLTGLHRYIISLMRTFFGTGKLVSKAPWKFHQTM